MKKQKRKKPGTGGSGKYYRLVMRSKKDFKTFRYHDVGERGGDLVRLAGKQQDGSWETQAWLVNKESAKVERGKIVALTKDVEDLLKTFGSKPRQIKDDIFEVKDKPGLEHQKYRHNIASSMKSREDFKTVDERQHGFAGGKAKRKKSK